jgi:pimeloyl-ACP methyl ester carboxylesterase
MAPVARGLEDQFRVLEPFQRGSGGEPLTVARHVADLHAIAAPLGRPALVGSSWGAMLALAYAAAHPESAGPLVLVGCGTFDLAARARFKAALDERMDDGLRTRIAALEREIPDADRRLAAYGDLLTPLYAFDPLPGDLGFEDCDARAHDETWSDMLRLQAHLPEGVRCDRLAGADAPRRVRPPPGRDDPREPPAPCARARVRPLGALRPLPVDRAPHARRVLPNAPNLARRSRGPDRGPPQP